MNFKNLIGQLPKIGIRPVIDGRLDGVRESLEESTMNMARIAADFLEKNLRHGRRQQSGMRYLGIPA